VVGLSFPSRLLLFFVTPPYRYKVSPPPPELPPSRRRRQGPKKVGDLPPPLKAVAHSTTFIYRFFPFKVFPHYSFFLRRTQKVLGDPATPSHSSTPSPFSPSFQTPAPGDPDYLSPAQQSKEVPCYFLLEILRSTGGKSVIWSTQVFSLVDLPLHIKTTKVKEVYLSSLPPRVFCFFPRLSAQIHWPSWRKDLFGGPLVSLGFLPLHLLFSPAPGWTRARDEDPCAPALLVPFTSLPFIPNPFFSSEEKTRLSPPFSGSHSP